MTKVVFWLLMIFSALVSLGCATQDRPLQLLAGQGPVYPEAARTAAIEGEVVVAYDVFEDGRVHNARVVSSRPANIFDEAALNAVRSWQFRAPVVDGHAQKAKNLHSTVVFKLGGADEYSRY